MILPWTIPRRRAVALCSMLLASLLSCITTPLYAAEKIDVTVAGVEGELRSNVMAHLSIVQHRSDANISRGRVRRLHRKAETEIRNALQPFGYYQPHIEATLSRTGAGWQARYVIDPGLPVRVTQVDIKIIGPGRRDPAFQHLVYIFPLHPGDVLNHGAYERAKSAFLDTALRRGYFDVRLAAHEIRIERGLQRALVRIHVDTGIRYRFGPVTFNQEPAALGEPERALQPDLLARYVPFKEGQLYSNDKLLQLQSALTDSDYFSTIEVQAQRQQTKNGRVPIDVTLKPRPKHRYAFGVGYGTDTGARASLGWDIRRINSSGHRLRNELKVSDIKKSYTSRYLIPIDDPTTSNITLSAGWVDERTRTNENESLLAEVSRTLGRGNGWLETIYLKLRKESYVIGTTHDDSRLILPGITWSRFYVDNRLAPRYGHRLNIDLKGSHPAFGSDAGFVFLQLHAQGKWVRSLGRRNRILARGDWGITKIDHFAKLPASLRFFTGGDNSVRGYGYQSLGPRDASGAVIGGEQLLVGSLELEHAVTSVWRVATFYDVGNALDNWNGTLKKGTGIGLRWETPIGPVRLDLAWAISEPGAPRRLHFTLGPDL